MKRVCESVRLIPNPHEKHQAEVTLGEYDRVLSVGEIKTLFLALAAGFGDSRDCRRLISRIFPKGLGSCIELRLPPIYEEQVRERFLIPVCHAASDSLVDHSRIVLIRKALDLVLSVAGLFRFSIPERYFHPYRLAPCYV